LHGVAAFELALKASDILFGKATEKALRSIDEKTFFQVFDGVPVFEIERESLREGAPIVELLATYTQVFPSKGEARKMVQANGVGINKEKVDLNKVIELSDFFNERYLLVQKGKKQYYVLVVGQ
jgi:tyrosyl-tRNA synthetase